MLRLVWCALAIASTIAGCGGGDGGIDRDGGLPRDGGDPDATASDEDASIERDASIEPDASSARECPLALACDAAPPDPGPEVDWRHSVATPITTSMGAAHHRGRDLILREGDPQWALAKFAYGLADDDLKDEDVAVYLLRGCGTTWEELGVVATTEEGVHATVEGVEDTGGRVYLEIPAAQRLGPGRHRVHFVVRGDHTTADQIIEVLPADARFVVTDVDGTQTESETAEWGAVLTGADPAHNPSGPELMTAYARRGYHVLYLTARPEWLEPRTHEWLLAHGYPQGIVHTTLGLTGATGAPAIEFKQGELEALLARFPGALDDAIGNTDSDTAAYHNVGVPPDRSFLYQYDPGADGTRVDDYATLIPMVEERPALCD